MEEEEVIKDAAADLFPRTILQIARAVAAPLLGAKVVYVVVQRVLWVRRSSCYPPTFLSLFLSGYDDDARHEMVRRLSSVSRERKSQQDHFSFDRALRQK